MSINPESASGTWEYKGRQYGLVPSGHALLDGQEGKMKEGAEEMGKGMRLLVPIADKGGELYNGMFVYRLFSQ
jgi:hypothetical protein